MNNTNNNQILDGEEEWPKDVFGFLRGERSCGLNLWVTYRKDKFGLNDRTKEPCGYPEIAEQNEIDEKPNGFYDEDYNPYVRLFADDIDDCGFGGGMPEAWKL